MKAQAKERRGMLKTTKKNESSQEESITQPTEGILGAETNYHLKNSSSNVNNEIRDSTGDISLAATDVDISKSLT